MVLAGGGGSVRGRVDLRMRGTDADPAGVEAAVITDNVYYVKLG